MQYREHGRSVLTCVSQPGGRLVSGCTDGIIKVLNSSLCTYNKAEMFENGRVNELCLYNHDDVNQTTSMF